MNIAYIALGSNLNNPKIQIDRALQNLQSIGTICAVSNWYQNKAIGPGNQPDFINGVVQLETLLDPFALLNQLQGIETQQGRERLIRWGSRTLDLDILLFNNSSLYSRRLTIPHPRLTERAFVVTPLLDINQDLKLPNGQMLAHYATKLNRVSLNKTSL